MPYRAPHPFAPPRPGGSTLEELVDRHAHLVAVGLANCRAAQALHKEITRRKLERRNLELETKNLKLETKSALPNDDDHYNPDEPRDKNTGRWTAGDSNSSTNSPSQPQEKPPQATLREPTARERLLFGLKELIYKLFPGIQPTVLPQKSISEVVDEGALRLGKFVLTALADLDEAFRHDPEFSGNIYAFLNRHPEMPIEAALREAAKEQQFRGEVPIAAIMGRIAEGIAVSLPMMALMAGYPPEVQKLIVLAFIAQSAKDTPETFKKLQNELAKPPEQRDPDKIDSLIAQEIQTLGFTVAGALGLKKMSAPEEAPKAPPAEATETQTTKPATGPIDAEKPPSEKSAPQPSEMQKPQDPDSKTPNEQKSEPKSLTEKPREPAGNGLRKSNNYRKVFFDAHPDLKGKVVVHHVIEQKVLKRYPGVITNSEMHSLGNLRGIPKDVNSEMHLRQIRKEWNAFYREHPTSVTKEQLIAKAREIDQKFGRFFKPPVTGANQ